MLMASSRVIASRSPPNSDLPRDSPTSSINIHSDQAARGFGSMNMDEIFRNIYPDSTSFDNGAAGGEAASGGGLSSVDGGDGGVRNGGGSKTVEEVWRDIVTGGGGGGGGGVSGGETAMTLEDFLAKAGAVNEEDVRVPAVVTMPPPPPAVGGFGMEGVMMSPAPGVPAVQFAAAGCVQNVIGVEFGSGMAAVSGSVGGGGRGKRRVAVDEVPLDKATQQKQRRMIKNRESAARSRERKQAYTVEMEAMVTSLEEEHARLLREELMENLIPVVEKRRPPRLLRSTRSI
ncbi:bZIP transcription factor 12-like isoform X2 [Salvia miltiorrhiza]|uniref:bZIP transcription factor 12-like isoform X2 n=1 Tax=Salvia miltiorrhiza TaxID=226208 RepID=UPI0025AC5341|nr:bZIP transcription factor 12-like isoform X2 [Salvia miltiorrhiza]